MSERPFMQLYVSDFIGDTLHLSTEQIGAYMLLLMAMWNAGGKLPADESKLARVVRMSVKKWRAVAGDLLPFFDVDGDTIHHNRLTKELQKSESKTQSRAAAGAEGGRAKALKDKEARVAIAMPEPQHLPDTITREEEHKERQKRATSALLPGFEDFWSAFPNKTGKPVAARAFAKALQRATAAEIMDGLMAYVAYKPADRPWLNPSTFLNQDRWNDRPATVAPLARAGPPMKPLSLIGASSIVAQRSRVDVEDRARINELAVLHFSAAPAGTGR